MHRALHFILLQKIVEQTKFLCYEYSNGKKRIFCS